MLNFLNDQPTKQATDAERAFLGLIEGGCQVPIGVHAVTEGDSVSIEAIIASLDGSTVLRDTIRGQAVNAAELGKEELLVTLIAQQIRNAVFNKTFYEVYNADDGRAWRWPAQTWNAIGYISLLLSGVFGLK